jgi:hypothetical protein
MEEKATLRSFMQAAVEYMKGQDSAQAREYAGTIESKPQDQTDSAGWKTMRRM